MSSNLNQVSGPKKLEHGRRYWRDRGGHGSPTSLRNKKKKGKEKEKRKTFKAETIKRLSLRSKCYCFSYSRVSRIQNFFWSANHGGRQYLSMFHGPSALKSISPALMKSNYEILEFIKQSLSSFTLNWLYHVVRDIFSSCVFHN